jgi:hypothetical protein
MWLKQYCILGVLVFVQLAIAGRGGGGGGGGGRGGGGARTGSVAMRYAHNT